MPRHAKGKEGRMNSRVTYSEDTIKLAMEDVFGGMSIRMAGKKRGIPESTLRHKITGYHPISMKMGPSTLLTEAEEQVVVNYIFEAARRAHPVTKNNVVQAITTILAQERQQGISRVLPPSFTNNGPGKKWWTLFSARHPDLTLRTPEALTTARRNISVAVIKQWFHDVKQYLADEEALSVLKDPSRNFNIDESGFSLNPKLGKVLAMRGEKMVFQEVSTVHKINITVLANVCANGTVPPPMIIYPRKRLNPQFAEEFPSGFRCTVGKSETGYITFETLYEFLCNDFNQWLTESGTERPVIVWTDWHETRNNYHLAKELRELKIILYGIPPNTTHLMQPLDVAVFGPLKKAWSKAVNEFESTHPNEVIKQHNFAKVFLPMYYKHVTPSNIQAGFAKCGLHPFCAEMPNYTKLTSSAAQLESSTVYEGVDQGGYKEMSTQTRRVETLNSRCQTESYYDGGPSGVANFLPGEKLPESLCDLVVEYKRYAPLRRYYEAHSLGTSRAVPVVETPGHPMAASGSSTPTETFRESSISPAVKNFKFYPERRPGRGPKIVKTVLDRVYAITSEQMIEELRVKKDKVKEKNVGKGKQSRGTAAKRTRETSSGVCKDQPRAKKDPPSKEPVTPQSQETSRIEDSSSSLEEADERRLVDDSTDDSLGLEEDPHNLCIKVPTEKPVINSWVGVCLKKVGTSGKGRKFNAFEVHIARVIDKDEAGLKVSFLKEKSSNFYVTKDPEDISYPVMEPETIVIEEPKSECRGRVYGFTFPCNITQALRGHFQSKQE